MKSHHVRKNYYSTDERGIANDTGLRVFNEQEALSKDVENDVSEVTEVSKQRLDKNVPSSTFTDGDLFYPRHEYLHIKANVSALKTLLL